MSDRIISLLFLFLSISQPLLPQQSIRFDHLTSEIGLSQLNVRNIAQDNNGFIWAGTQDGLNRYDGYNFITIRKNDKDSVTLKSNLISALLLDRNGYLWIATLGGLSKYDPVNDRFIKIEVDKGNSENLNLNAISLVEDKDGCIWFGTYLHGLHKYNPVEKSLISFYSDGNPENISNNSIFVSYRDEKDNLWFGTWGGSLCRYNSEQNNFTRYDKYLPDTLNSIAGSDDGRLAIGSTTGLFFFNPQTLKVQPVEVSAKGLSSNEIQSLIKDKAGLWISTSEGLNYYNFKTKEIQVFKFNEHDGHSLNDNSVTCAFVDKNGLLWVGTVSGGLNKGRITSNGIRSYLTASIFNEVADRTVRCILEEKKGDFWAGTDDGLLLTDKNFVVLKKFINNPDDPGSISSNQIWDVKEDGEGNIWIATQSGLNLLKEDGKSFNKFLNKGNKENIPFNIIRTLYFDKRNTLWIGTYSGGIIRYNLKDKTFKSYRFDSKDKNSISDDIIFNIHEDKEGFLWFCAVNGLNRFDRRTEKFERYFDLSQKNKLPVIDAFYTLYEDEIGNFWIGNLGTGLVLFNPNNLKYKIYNEEIGLANNVIYGIIPDSSGNLWLSTNKGISKFSIKEERFTNYDRNDGLSGMEFNTGAYTKTNNGKILFGGVDGLVVIDPELISENKNVPDVALTDFNIFNNPVFRNKIFLNGDKLELPYSDNYFSFQFTALDFTDPVKNHYLYKIEGYDNNWINPGGRRYASYTNLEPGEYVIRVKASNNSGVWNEKGLSVPLIIKHPYWQTWWFRILAAIIFCGIIFYIYKHKINILKKEREAEQKFSRQLIESQEMERKRIASELHDGLGQNLLIIKNRSRMAEKGDDIEKVRNQMNIISNVAAESIDDVRRISYNLHPYFIDEVGITSSIKTMINKFDEAVPIKFIAAVDKIDDLLPPEHQINIYRIIQEAANNIIKHSEATEVKLTIVKKEKEIIITIEDNGVGFSNKPDIKNDPAKGFGLRDIRERVKICGGQLSIQSEPGNGTFLKTIIPLNQNE